MNFLVYSCSPPINSSDGLPHKNIGSENCNNIVLHVWSRQIEQEVPLQNDLEFRLLLDSTCLVKNFVSLGGVHQKKEENEIPK